MCSRGQGSWSPSLRLSTKHIDIRMVVRRALHVDQNQKTQHTWITHSLKELLGEVSLFKSKPCRVWFCSRFQTHPTPKDGQGSRGIWGGGSPQPQEHIFRFSSLLFGNASRGLHNQVRWPIMGSWPSFVTHLSGKHC